MSEYIHTAIVVTGPNFDGRVDVARQSAINGGLTVTEMARGRNSHESFMAAPSGAGSMHASSDAHNHAIETLIEYLSESSIGQSLDWVAIRFGREHGTAKVIRDCGDAKADAEIWRKSLKWRPRQF